MGKLTKPFFTAILIAVLSAGLAAFGESQPRGDATVSGNGLLDVIVTRMEEAQQKNRDNYRAYTMTRDYRIYGSDEQKANSKVIANVRFEPPKYKDFHIEKAEGSDRGQKIVRHILESEVTITAQDAPGAITRANYDFKLLGDALSDGQPSWILQLIPKRDEKVLIRGRIWVDKESYLVHHLEGEMAKTPSWWLKKVQMSLGFANAAGMWLQTDTHAMADVRMFGSHTFTSHVTKVQTADDVAETFSPLPPAFLTTSVAGLRKSASPAGTRVLALGTPGAVPPAKTAQEVRTARAIRRRPTRPVPSVIGAGVLVPR